MRGGRAEIEERLRTGQEMKRKKNTNERRKRRKRTR